MIYVLTLPMISRQLHKWLIHRARIVELRDGSPHGALLITDILDTTTLSNQQLAWPMFSVTPTSYLDRIIQSIEEDHAPNALERWTCDNTEASLLHQQLTDIKYLWVSHYIVTMLKWL
jgi:hypothetical protein